MTPRLLELYKNDVVPKLRALPRSPAHLEPEGAAGAAAAYTKRTPRESRSAPAPGAPSWPASGSCLSTGSVDTNRRERSPRRAAPLRPRRQCYDGTMPMGLTLEEIQEKLESGATAA